MFRVAIAGAVLLALAPGNAAGQPARIVSVDPVALQDGSPDGLIVRLTFPAKGTALPVAILSHGNRLSREDYAPLVAALARAGYLVVQPDHPDASVEGFPPSAPQPEDVWRSRIDELRWIATHLGALGKQEALLRGRIDMSRVAVIGHSFGGQTAALAMGARVARPGGIDMSIPGVRAAVLLAPPGHFEGLTDEWKRRAPYLDMDWEPMRGPVLTIIGGNDTTALTNRGPAWHADPYRRASAGRGMCLMQVDGAGHYLGGIDSVLRPPAGDATPMRRARLFGTVIDFLDANLSRVGTAQTRWSRARSALDCK